MHPCKVLWICRLAPAPANPLRCFWHIQKQNFRCNKKFSTKAFRSQKAQISHGLDSNWALNDTNKKNVLGTYATIWSPMFPAGHVGLFQVFLFEEPPADCSTDKLFQVYYLHLLFQLFELLHNWPPQLWCVKKTSPKQWQKQYIPLQP